MLGNNKQNLWRCWLNPTKSSKRWTRSTPASPSRSRCWRVWAGWQGGRDAVWRLWGYVLWAMCMSDRRLCVGYSSCGGCAGAQREADFARTQGWRSTATGAVEDRLLPLPGLVRNGQYLLTFCRSLTGNNGFSEQTSINNWQQICANWYHVGISSK